MSPQSDFSVIFEQLKNILKPYAGDLTVKADTADTYYLDGPYSETWKKELFFGSAFSPPYPDLCSVSRCRSGSDPERPAPSPRPGSPCRP